MTKKKKKIFKLNSDNYEVVSRGIWFPTNQRIRANFHYKNSDGKIVKSVDSYPKWSYQKILDEFQDCPELLQKELEKLCLKINKKQFGRAWEQANAVDQNLKKSPWITKSLKNSFYEFLLDQIPSTKDAKYQYTLLSDRCLTFFQSNLDLPNPADWKAKELEWGKSLLNINVSDKLRIWEDETFRPSKKTLDKIIQIANRFLKFMYDKNKDIASRELIQLTPISRAKMNHYIAEMVDKKIHKDSEDIGHYMSKKNFDILIKHLRRGKEYSLECSPDDISPYVQMCYFYGLRRSESMALKAENLKETHLLVERQVEKLSKDKFGYETKVLKGRTKRKTPHWMIDPDDAYNILQVYESGLSRVFHPDTFTDKFSKAIAEINLEDKFEDGFGNKTKIQFTIHDLRRSFITNALRMGINPVDVQLAVGHKDLRTTLSYQTDDRSLDDRVYKPKNHLKKAS